VLKVFSCVLETGLTLGFEEIDYLILGLCHLATVTATLRSGHFSFLMSDDESFRSQPDVLLVLLPLLIILSTFLFLLLTFLICVVIVRRRRGIILRDNDGPVDLSREDLIEGDGGFSNIESRWLEESNENLRRTYLRAKGVLSLLFLALPRVVRHSYVYTPQSTKYNTLQILNQPT